MSGRLAGKVAIISGGSSGIGATTARLFIAEGARVVIADRVEPADEDLLAGMQADAEAVSFISADVTREEDVRAAAASAKKRWGRLDIAVACAGIPGSGMIPDMAAAQWDQVMDVNVKGVFFLTKHALPEMLKSGGGSIINISSAFGIVGGAGFAAYCASKGAVRLFTKATALEYAGEKIRANSIHPGVIETPMMRQSIAASPDPEGMLAAVMAQHPIGFAGRPEDIGWGCVYLASDEARFVTGSELVIDGGMTAR